MKTMNQRNFYTFLQKHILLMIGLSLLPGLAYIGLAWLNDIVLPALVWYLMVLIVSVWGYRLYRAYKPEQMLSDEWVTKYRYHVLKGDVQKRCKDLNCASM